MEGYKIKLGRYGEKLAAEFLMRRGCQIIDKNFYTPYGEIDLIAQTGDEILFCEVKTRTTSVYGFPEEAVDKHKREKFLTAAQVYLSQNNFNQFWRFDIISVQLDLSKKKAQLRWFRDITLT